MNDQTANPTFKVKLLELREQISQMFTIRAVAGLLFGFNAIMVLAMLALSKGEVYALTIMSITMLVPVIMSQMYRRKLLLNTMEKQFTALFVVLIMCSVYYTCFTVTILAYFQSSTTISTQFSMIIMTNLDRDTCIWFDLSFYFINCVLFWLYTQRYHAVYWVDTIRQIFKLLKTETQLLNQHLMSKLKTIAVPDELLRAECPLCLEKYSLVHQVSRLPCKHTFHFDCIRMWLYQKKSCPVCRGCVILY